MCDQPDGLRPLRGVVFFDCFATTVFGELLVFMAGLVLALLAFFTVFFCEESVFCFTARFVDFWRFPPVGLITDS
jgi:hypothetical protein